MFTNPVCDQSHLRSLLLDVYTEETFQSLTNAKQSKAKPVSYTHLTLPTIYSV